MKHLWRLFRTLPRPAQPRLPKKLLWSMALIAAIGFGDATYIAVNHAQGVIPPCSVLNGCENVLTSSFSSVGPIRLEWIGMSYYLVILGLVMATIDTRNGRYVWWASRFSVVGLLTSLGLVSIQIFILEALCLYCMVSAVTSTLLFICGVYMLQLNHASSHS